MKKILLAVAAAIALVAGVPTVALANGSDAPTPYVVDSSGITLPDGATFPDNGHVNITADVPHHNLHFEAKCIDRTDAECAGDRHADAQFIGESFIPWSAFGLSGSFCVSWVQISMFNEHYGEGEQPPVGPGCASPTPEPEPEPTPEPTPTPDPTPEPAPEPTPEPTPTVEPTPEPMPEPTEVPMPTETPGTPSETPSPQDETPAPESETPAPQDETPEAPDGTAPTELAATGADPGRAATAIGGALILAIAGTVTLLLSRRRR